VPVLLFQILQQTCELLISMADLQFSLP